eukprot:PhM_4_TR18479/c0_g1_i6/m.21119
MILGRVFIWEKPWKWGPEPCGNRGTDCFFIPPTNCTLHHVGRISDKLPSSKIRESRTRTIRKTWWNTKDMRLIDAPDSFVPGGKEAAVAFREERKWGRGEYSTWANAHALRYLMRAPQPWLANIIEQEIIETMGFPWAEVPRLTAVHLRGGDKRKEYEVFRATQCRVIKLSGYASILKSELQSDAVAASADVDTILQEFKDSVGATGLSPRYIHTPFPKPDKKGLDSRDYGAKVYGKLYVTLVSFLDLFVAVSADAWIFYSSNWSSLINQLRKTAGRVHCPSVNTGTRVNEDKVFREKFCDTAKPTGWVDEAASPWGWVTTPQR